MFPRCKELRSLLTYRAGLEILVLVYTFIYFSTKSAGTGKTLARLCGGTGWSDPSLDAYGICTKVSCAGLYIVLYIDVVSYKPRCDKILSLGFSTK